MNYGDIFKNSFMEEFSISSFSLSATVLSIVLAGLIGIYIFFCYKFITRKTFYSRNFNISLIVIAIVIAGIIAAIQSSIIISLGMVGALSIVRFRTAIKDPMDLAFLFWSISVGLICGAHLSIIAIFVSLLVTIVVMVFSNSPNAKAPQILVINATTSNATLSSQIEDVLRAHTKSFIEKSRNITNGKLDLVFELRTEQQEVICNELSSIEDITSVSLLKHDGEVTF